MSASQCAAFPPLWISLRGLNLVLARAAEYALRGKFHTGPISLRFVAGSSAMLADHEDACRMEIIFTRGARHAPAMMRDYEDSLARAFCGAVRPHWGQIDSLGRGSGELLDAMYPRQEEWKRLRRVFDPRGMFLNDCNAGSSPDAGAGDRPSIAP